MTSLSRQLDALRVAASSQLAVERPHVSLLFDKKEAAALYKEEALKIGQAGLSQLRKIDSHIGEEEEELFTDVSLNVQRALLSKEENDRLNERLERLLTQLSPYLLHFAAQQVIEWLIFRFQIHAFNGAYVFITFLPFHESNIFGRLLSLLDLRGIEYDWVRDYGKAQAPIPLTKIVTKCFSSNHSVLSMLSRNIERALQLVGEEYAEKKLPHLFTFYAQLGVHLVRDSKKVNEALISKLIPFIAVGLKSRVASLRLSCLMVTSQLCLSVTLTHEILHSLMKVVLLKINAATAQATLLAAVVICQRQNVASLPLRGVKKMARVDADLNITKQVQALSTKTDLSKFLTALWQSILPLFNEEGESEEIRDQLSSLLIATSEGEILDGSLATSLFSLIFETLEGTPNREKVLPKAVRKHIRTLILRFGEAFDAIRGEWAVRDGSLLPTLMKICKIQDYEVGDMVIQTSDRKRRRRSSSCRRSVCEDEPNTISEPRNTVPKSKHAKKLVAEAQVEALKEVPKVTFKGDPMEKLPDVIAAGQWDLAEVGLQKLVTEKYLKRYSAADYEEFIVSMVKFAIGDAASLKSAIRQALSKLPMRNEFALALLEREGGAPSRKRLRSAAKNVSKGYFVDETDAIYCRRVVFVLEILNVSEAVGASAKLFGVLFDILKGTLECEGEAGSEEFYKQQLCVSLIVRLLQNPLGYTVKKEDLHMDCVVHTIRSTLNQSVLRDCLRILTAAVTIAPGSVLSQTMSIFTFMGSGMLKKDNDFTLGIIEETLNALFSAVLSGKGSSTGERLVSLSQIFASAVLDIPAHRRVRILHAAALAAGPKHSWMLIGVLFARFCIYWQRSNAPKGRLSVEEFEEMASELVSVYGAGEQLECAIDLIEFVIRLGGDFAEESKKRKSGSFRSTSDVTEKIFERSKHSLQKLRHYRFALLGWIARLLSSTDLLEKLSELDDEVMCEVFVPIGKRLLASSLALDEFVTSQSDQAEKTDASNALPGTSHFKYWIALASRADIVSEKFRNLLPSSVGGRIIAEVLEEGSTSPKLRDRALQLLNAKLMQESGGGRVTRTMQLAHLYLFANKLNSWIVPAESKDDVVLCQNGAFSLRLIAQRVPSSEDSNPLQETIERCVKLLSQWRALDEAMVGNVLLLAGEVVRSQKNRASMVACDVLASVCVDVLNAQLECPPPCPSAVLPSPLGTSTTPEPDVPGARRKRIAQQSMSGRRIGGDTMPVCGLTCLQRVLDQYAQFIPTHLTKILLAISRVAVRYDPRLTLVGVSAEKLSTMKLTNVQHRISQIRKAIAKVEMRVIIEPFEKAVDELIIEPKASVFLFSLLSSCVKSADRLVILKVLTAVNDLFFHGFSLRGKNLKPEEYETVEECEGFLVDSFLRVIDCLTESEFRVVISRMLKWIETAMESKATVDVRTRLLTTFTLLNRFFDSYNVLAVSYFARFFELVPQILRRLNGSLADVDTMLFVGKKGTIEALTANSLITLVINFVRRASRRPEFFTEERAYLVLEPLVNEMDNSVVFGHEGRCVPHLADCLFSIADTRGEILMEMFTKIMLKTRNTSAKIRYRTLLVVERMFDRMGDGVAPLLPSVLPFLSELLEDENKKVEEQCDKVLAVLRKKFGEEIADGFM